MHLTCQRCEHNWFYRGSQDYYTNCPRCMVKVRTIPPEFIGEEIDDDYREDNKPDLEDNGFQTGMDV